MPVTSCAHSSLILTPFDKSLPLPKEPRTTQKPVLLPRKELKATLSSFPISLGFARPTEDNDLVLGRVSRLHAVYLRE